MNENLQYVLALIMDSVVVGLVWQHDYSFCRLIKARNTLNEHADCATLILKEKKEKARAASKV